MHAQSDPVMDSLEAVVKAGLRDTNTVNAAKELAFRLKYENVDAAIRYGFMSLRLAQDLGFSRGIAKAYLTTGQCYMISGENDKALECFRLGSIEAQRSGFRRLVFQGYLNAGIAFELKGNFIQSVKAQLEARRLAEADGRDSDVRDCDYNLGITYSKLGNNTLALQRFQAAAESYKAAGDLDDYSGALSGIGNIYSQQKDYKRAQRYYEDAIAVARDLGPQTNLAPKYLNLGGALYFQKDYPAAIANMRIALDLAAASGQHSLLADAYTNLSSCYRMVGNNELAAEYGLKGLELAKAMNAVSTEIEALGNLAEVFAKKGAAQRALDYYREMEALKDSMRLDEAAAEIANMRVQYESEKNALKLLQLQERTDAATAKAEYNAVWVYAAFSTAIATFLALIVVLLQHRTRKRHAELLLAQRNAEFAARKRELEQRALRAQMNPHFIFNSLNAIQRLYIEGDLDRAGDYMSDFAQILRKILDHSGCDTISLAAELETLRLYLRLEEARLDGILRYEIEVDEEIDLFHTQIPPLILQPFVENAIWHGILPAGGNGKVHVRLTEGTTPDDEGLLRCTITDDGVGIETSLKAKRASIGHESKGIKISRERLGQRGEVLTEELPQGGTRIEIKIPVIIT